MEKELWMRLCSGQGLIVLECKLQVLLEYLPTPIPNQEQTQQGTGIISIVEKEKKVDSFKNKKSRELVQCEGRT
jgi:hypothetical protein